MQRLRRPFTFIGLLLIAVAVVQQLRLPRDSRTWHGVLFGWIPYDLRLPTLGRLSQTWWNPDEPRILVPTAFGVGWSINAAAVFNRLGSG